MLLELVRKDIAWALGEGGIFHTAFAFSFSVAIFLSFVLSPAEAKKVSWQIFWIPFFFSSVFPPLRLAEADKNLIPTLLPLVGNEKIFLAKLISNTLVLLFISAGNLLLFAFFLSLEFSLLKLTSVFLAVLGVSAVSTVFSFLVGRDIILVIILLPLLSPLFISAVSIGEGKTEFFKIIVGFDVVSTALAWAVFDLSES